MQTTKRSSGVSLLEVLAAMFVISIGLLGVLAVIPFGAFQVSKARDAEYASNMLANATIEIEIRKMAQPAEWGHLALDSAGQFVFGPIPSNTAVIGLNCTKFIWVEPWAMPDPANHIFCINSFAPADKWDDVMRGQDDLVYVTHDGKRPVLKFNEKGKPISSGKYSWFFTYLPTTDETEKDKVPLDKVDQTVTVDVLACYNRVPSDDRQVPSGAFAPSISGGAFTLPPEVSELLTQTKYVFVTWGETQAEGGAWCRIVFVDRSTPSTPRIIVTGNLDSISNNIQVYIPSGVLYHKQRGVPIR